MESQETLSDRNTREQEQSGSTQVSGSGRRTCEGGEVGVWPARSPREWSREPGSDCRIGGRLVSDTGAKAVQRGKAGLFTWLVPGNPARDETELFSYTAHKSQSKIVQRPTCTWELNYKTLTRSPGGRSLWRRVWQWLFWMWPRMHRQYKENWYTGLRQNVGHYQEKEREPTEWEKMRTGYIPGQRLIFRTYKQLP